jgi:DNA-binding SARP family transcriptional activator
VGGEAGGAALDFRLLGPLEVRANGDVLPLPGPRQAALLALLLLHPNEVVPRGRLVDGLWGERPPASAANALQVAAHALRKLLGRDRLETRGDGYLLRVDPGEIDLQRAESLLARARDEREPAAAAARPWAGISLF